VNWPDNPYPFGTPVPSNDAFIDRESELNRLKKAYKSSRANLVLIEGARRIGKSSLLHQFRRSLATETVCLELDLQTLDIAHGLPVRQEDATQTILGHLLGQLREVLAPEKSISAVNNVKEFQASYDDLIGNANSSKRIVVLLDELDVLQERYPTSIEDLLEAFRIRSASRVLLVCCCGRPLGAPRTQSLANLLQPSTPIELEPFDEEITWAALDLARVYGFSRSARDLFWEVTQGHPLWVSAISHYIYAERELKADISEVDTPELQKALTPSAQWFKNAIWHAWRQVGPVQSLFGRAVADITWRDDEKRFVGVATGSQIESELRPFFSGIDADQL
jgi:chloramphenicol 3-O-phosphotransferase